jgi:site-specific DNA-cytosine methylase
MSLLGDYNVDTTKKLPTVLSFCSGYGGIERGLDLAGVEHEVLAYVEIEAFAIANLVAKMEKGELGAAPIYTDLKTFPAHLFRGAVDIITGGYPCQPFSAAGKRAGADDPRHLWPFIREHVQTIRPVRCFFENVEGHISLGLSSVISDLEEDGYRAAWGIFSAAEVGAPHQRKRVFIMANSEHGFGKTLLSQEVEPLLSKQNKQRESNRFSDENIFNRREWPVEPSVGRVVDGCPFRVDRLRLLGNSVVPQTAALAWTTLNERQLST